MSDPGSTADRSETDRPEGGHVVVRYWASARSAAGVESEAYAVEGALTLRDLLDRVVARHRGGRLPRVLEVCSVLVGEQPVASEDPRAVLVPPGSTVELLPPFAGG